jgi:hypothetical protein
LFLKSPNVVICILASPFHDTFIFCRPRRFPRRQRRRRRRRRLQATRKEDEV